VLVPPYVRAFTAVFEILIVLLFEVLPFSVKVRRQARKYPRIIILHSLNYISMQHMMNLPMCIHDLLCKKIEVMSL
jgi:hypothetical protein